MVKRVIFGEVGNAHVAELKDINGREALVLGAFAAGVLVLRRVAQAADRPDGPSIAQLAAQLAASKL
jgi:NADH-quinone oxidoreductase subunit M